ncbi:hypothetical protein DTR88_24640 [Salmonella enterica]|nr:hypothetical protein [Salmonella enterica]
MARSSDCNKAGYRAATTRQCQNNGSLANGEAFIQTGMRFLKAAGVWLLLLLLFAAVVRQGLRLSGTAAILSSQK